jgi:hypothetical protein
MSRFVSCRALSGAGTGGGSTDAIPASGVLAQAVASRCGLRSCSTRSISPRSRAEVASTVVAPLRDSRGTRRPMRASSHGRASSTATSTAPITTTAGPGPVRATTTPTARLTRMIVARNGSILGSTCRRNR